MATVWIYWEPPKAVPPYFEFCLRQIEKYAGFVVEVVSHQDAIDLGCDLPAKESVPYLAHCADMARAQLLSMYGGITLDADTLVMPSFHSHYSQAISDDLEAFGPADPRGFFVYGMYAPPTADWPKQWVAKQKAALKAGRKEWVAFGAPLLWQIKYPSKTKSFVLERSEIVPWNQIDRMMGNEPLEPLLSPDTPFVCLFNKGLSELTKDMSLKQILSGDTLLGQLLRYSDPDWRDFL